MFFYSFSGFLLPGWLPGDPGPFPNERSRISHLLHGPKTLIGQDLTHFYLTQSLGLHFFKRPAIYAQKTPLLPLRITIRIKGNFKFPPFPLIFFNDSQLTPQFPFIRMVAYT